MRAPKKLIYWVLLILGASMIISCDKNEQITARLSANVGSTIEDEMIDLNWSYAVKDLYFLDLPLYEFPSLESGDGCRYASD